MVTGVHRAHGARLLSQARPRLDLIRRARIPVLVASGGHAAAHERICDALAITLGGERTVHVGAGHFVAAAPGFTDRLDTFLRTSESQDPDPDALQTITLGVVALASPHHSLQAVP
ncbi:hypothetical protein [Streptomyces sp. NPDC006552]|uniref:hypothetical protein n=1 Tax=Streptomyces sp. NPDC006552 TaxID=3157179 RepID=UPI0033A2BFDF